MRRFAVIGSTGKHYVVTLSDPRQTCQCMDFRMRKRQCKHILLVLSGMGIADNPKNWKEVSCLVASSCILLAWSHINERQSLSKLISNIWILILNFLQAMGKQLLGTSNTTKPDSR